MLRRTDRIRQFGLYGEGAGVIEPEFVHIEAISARSSLHNWTIAPHMHPGIFQLLYIASGEAWMAVDGENQRLNTPALVLLPCGCTHAFRFDPRAQGWVLSIADTLAADSRFATIDTDGVMRGARISTLSLVDDKPHAALLHALFSEFDRRHREAPGHLGSATMALIALVLATIEELADKAEAEGAGGLHRRIALVRRFTRLVEQHYSEHWPVERYAAELGTTAPTLNRACREVTGKPPGRIALDRLLREAMRALSYSTASISEISDDLGFSDPAYFARIFRKHSGVTASAFRRERVWMAPADRL